MCLSLSPFALSLYFSRFLSLSLISLSLSKTNYSIIFPKQEQEQEGFELKIGDTTLEKKRQAKLLGIILQDDLKHGKTVLNIVGKLQPIIQTIRHVKKYLNPRQLKHIYDQHVYPLNLCNHGMGNLRAKENVFAATYNPT